MGKIEAKIVIDGAGTYGFEDTGGVRGSCSLVPKEDCFLHDAEAWSVEGVKRVGLVRGGRLIWSFAISSLALEQDRKSGRPAWVLCPNEKTVNVISMAAAGSTERPVFYERDGMTMEEFPVGDGRKVIVAIPHNAVNRCLLVLT